MVEEKRSRVNAWQPFSVCLWHCSLPDPRDAGEPACFIVFKDECIECLKRELGCLSYREICKCTRNHIGLTVSSSENPQHREQEKECVHLHLISPKGSDRTYLQPSSHDAFNPTAEFQAEGSIHKQVPSPARPGGFAC